MSNHTDFVSLSSDQLADISGGGLPGWVKPAAKFVGKKVLGPVSAAWTAYDGVSGFLKARDQGKSFGDSVKDGVKNAIF